MPPRRYLFNRLFFGSLIFVTPNDPTMPLAKTRKHERKPFSAPWLQADTGVFKMPERAPKKWVTFKIPPCKMLYQHS